MAKYEEFIAKIKQRQQATQLVRNKMLGGEGEYTRKAVDAVGKLLDTLLLIAEQGGVTTADMFNYAWNKGPIIDLVKYLDALEKNDVSNTKWSVIIHNDITYQLAASYLAFLSYLAKDEEPQDMLSLLDPGSKKVLFTDVPQRLKQTVPTYFLAQPPAHQFNEALFDMLPDELQESLRASYEQQTIIIEAKKQLDTFQRSLQAKIPVPAEPPAELLIRDGNQLSITVINTVDPVLDTKQRHYSAAKTALNTYQAALIAKRDLLPKNIAACRDANPIPEDTAAYPKPFHTAVDTLYAQIEAEDRNITQQLSQIEKLLVEVDRELQEINRLREEQDPARLSNQISAAQERLTTASTMQPTTLASSYVEDPVKQALLNEYIASAAQRKTYLEEAIPVLQTFQSILDNDDITQLTAWESTKTSPISYFLGGDSEDKAAEAIDGFFKEIMQQESLKQSYFPRVRQVYETIAHPIKTVSAAGTYVGQQVGFFYTKETMIEYLDEKITAFRQETLTEITTDEIPETSYQALRSTQIYQLQIQYQAEVHRPAIERAQVGFLDEYSQSIDHMERLQAKLSLTVLQREQYLADFNTCKATLDALLQDPSSAITALENEQSTAGMSHALMRARELGQRISAQLKALDTEKKKIIDIQFKLVNKCPERYQEKYMEFNARFQTLTDERQTVQQDQRLFEKKHQELLDLLKHDKETLELKKLDQLALACDQCIQENKLPTDGVSVVPVAEKPIRLKAIKAQQHILENPHGFFVQDQASYGQKPSYGNVILKKGQLDAVAEDLNQAIASDQKNFQDKRAQLTADFFNDGNGFTKYLAQRNATYAIRDWFEFFTIGFFGLFWEQTEYSKRNNYVHKLQNAAEQYVLNPSSIGELRSLLKQGKQKGLFTNQYFSPRCPKGQPDYDKTLQHQLEEFSKALTDTEKLNAEPAMTACTY